MSQICDRAQVARSTPSRWRGRHNGANLETVKRLNEALSSIVAERVEVAAGDHAVTVTTGGTTPSPGKSGDVTAQAVSA